MSASVKLITKQVKTTGAWAVEIEDLYHLFLLKPSFLHIPIYVPSSF